MRAFLRFVLTIIALAAGTGAVGGWYLLNQFQSPGPEAYEGETQTIVSIPLGTGLNQTANILQERGVVRSALIFRAGVTYNGKASAIKAGEYAIPSGASPEEIMNILTDGKSIAYKLTFAEGLTSAMIVDLIRKDPTLTGDIADVPAEGSLLPETYTFNRGDTRESIVKRMQDDHNRVLDELWANRAQNLPIATKEEAVILASIVEKETGIPEERPRVASVFVNRLRRGMKLQSDPTIIYGISKGVPLGRGIRQSELTGATPYNTYVIVGLPPTPIANPGKASLAAVMNPAQTEDLFFVANGTGGHAFAATVAEHDKNVKKWRQIEKERAAASAGSPTSATP